MSLSSPLYGFLNPLSANVTPERTLSSSAAVSASIKNERPFKIFSDFHHFYLNRLTHALTSEVNAFIPLGFFLGISESSLGALLLLDASSLCEAVVDGDRESLLAVVCFFVSLVEWLCLLVTGELT